MKRDPIPCKIRAKLLSSDIAVIEIIYNKSKEPILVKMDKQETCYLADELFKLYKQMQ